MGGLLFSNIQKTAPDRQSAEIPMYPEAKPGSPINLLAGKFCAEGVEQVLEVMVAGIVSCRWELGLEAGWGDAMLTRCDRMCGQIFYCFFFLLASDITSAVCKSVGVRGSMFSASRLFYSSRVSERKDGGPCYSALGGVGPHKAVTHRVNGPSLAFWRWQQYCVLREHANTGQCPVMTSSWAGKRGRLGLSRDEA
jgi:hypothetical protein